MAAGFKLLDAYVEVRADASKVIPEAEREIRSGAGRMSSAGGGLGSSLMGGMQGVIGGLVGGVVSAFAVPLVQGVGQAVDAVLTTAKSAIFDYNTTLENANIGFTTMLGSAQKARSFLGELQTFAAKTPFEFSDLTLASQRLIAMGIHAKEVIPTMTAIGDAVAGLGGDKGTIDQLTTAIGQMAAKGKVQGDELMQLTEAGVPALKILADGYGVTTSRMSDMISAGQVLSDKAIPMIVRGLEKGTKTTAGFGGMMAKQSQTMAGSLSNISDSINQTLSKAFLPMFKVVERAAGALAKFGGSKAVTNWAKDTAANVGKFLGQVEKAVKSVFADPAVQKAMGQFGIRMSQAFAEIGPALKTIIPNLASFAKNTLPAVIDAMTAVVKYIPVMVRYFATLSVGLRVIGPAVGAVLKLLNMLGLGLSDMVGKASDAGNSIVHTFTGFGVGMVRALTGIPAQMNTMGANIVQGLIGGIQSKIGDALATIQNMAGQVAGAFAKVLQIQSPSKVFHQYGKWIVEGLHKGLLGSVSDVKSASAALAGAIRDSFASKAISKSTEKAMLSELKDTTMDLVNLAGRRQKILDKLSDQRDKLAGLKSDRSDYRANIRSNVLGSGNLVSLYGDAAAGTTVTAGAATGSLDGRTYTGSYSTTSSTPGQSGLSLVKSNLRKLLADTKKFTANMKTLVKRGIYKDLFQQLMDAGPTAGLALTNDLISDRASFNDINSLGKQLATAGNSLGDFGAGFTYDGQIKSTQKAINRLDRQADQITVNMIVEAKKIDEVDKVVKMIHAAKHAAKAKNAGKRKAKR